MVPIPILDPADDRLGDYRALTDPQLRKRYEGQAGVFIAEGPNVVRELLASRYPVRSLLLSPHQLGELAADLDRVEAPIYVADRELIREVVRFQLHQGALGCGGRLPVAEPDDVIAGARLLLVLEGMNDHENMGVLFRTARALGVDGVLLQPGSADPLYRRCVRVSMGHVLHVPWAPIDAAPEGLDALRAAGFTTLALTPDGTELLADVAAATTGPVVLVLGAEGPGVSKDAAAAVDRTVRIEMRNGVDSLNVATAAAIALHRLTSG